MTTEWSRRIIAQIHAVEIGISSVVPVFIGQEALKRRVTPFLNRERRFPHTLIVGEPGIGKTLFAQWLAYSRAVPFEELLAPVVPEQLPETGFVLLDEAHLQARPERIFPYMEAPGSEMTVIAATTRPERLEPAFKSRFFLRLRMERLNDSDMGLIIRHLAEKEITDEQVELFASAAAGNPRQAELIMATAHGIGTYDTEEVLSTCGINADGLDELHMKYLKVLYGMGRPVGLVQLSAITYVDESTLQGHERLLLELDLVELSTKGRTLTRDGRKYVDQLERP